MRPNARCLYKGPAPRCSNRSARAGAAPEGSPPTRAVGTLSAQGRAITTHSNVYVIHQNRDDNTTFGCAPTKKYSPGYILNANYSSTDASYNADTLGGSSGSPVFSATTHEVVALHHSSRRWPASVCDSRLLLNQTRPEGPGFPTNPGPSSF